MKKKGDALSLNKALFERAANEIALCECESLFGALKVHFVVQKRVSIKNMPLISSRKWFDYLKKVLRLMGT